jgi:hypothetical protein
LQVDDAQSAEAETDAWFNKVPVPIRSTVGHHVRHAMKHVPVDRPLGICIHNAAQSAHSYSYSRVSLFLLANAR